jgi:hypothetical protein
MIKNILIATLSAGLLLSAQLEPEKPSAVPGFRGCVERCIQKCLDERRPAEKCKCGWCNVFRTQDEKGKLLEK